VLRGQLAADADRPEEALRWLRRAVEITPYEPEANAILGLALRRANLSEEAQQYEEKSRQILQGYKRMEQITREISRNPSNVELRREAGAILMRIGQDKQALSWLISALSLEPRHQPTRQALAECVARLGDPRLVDYGHRLVSEDNKGD